MVSNIKSIVGTETNFPFIDKKNIFRENSIWKPDWVTSDLIVEGTVTCGYKYKFILQTELPLLKIFRLDGNSNENRCNRLL